MLRLSSVVIAVAAATMVAVACSDSYSASGTTDSDSGTPPSTAGTDAGDSGTPSADTFSVGGTVTGLLGTGLVLQNNAGDDLTLVASGTFTFHTKLAKGAAFAVTVKTQPTGQMCVVTNRSGNMGAADVTNVAVTCSAGYSVGGTVSNLSGSVVLTDNGGDDLTVSANGPFAFTTKLASGSSYQVAVKTQPPSMICSVVNGGPTPVGNADVTTVAVACLPSGISDTSYFFPFDGNTNDFSPNKHDLTNSGATLVADRRGTLNSAYAFDGTTAYMTADGAGLVTGAGARTMSMWIYPANTNNGTGVFYQGNGDCNGLMFGLGHQPLNFFWGGCRDANAVTGLPVNTWTFVGVVFTPPDNIKLYTGTTVETFTVPDINTATSNLWVGGETISNNLVFRNHFTGRLDELRIYNRALTDAEMATLANLP